MKRSPELETLADNDDPVIADTSVRRKQLAGGAAGEPAPYIGMCHLFCESVQDFQAGFVPHAQQLMADMPNYTDQAPVLQISEVVTA